MDDTQTLAATYQSCVVELNAETRKRLGIPSDAIVIRQADNETIEVEILATPSPALLAEFQETYEEMKDVFAELKRLGD